MIIYLNLWVAISSFWEAVSHCEAVGSYIWAVVLVKSHGFLGRFFDHSETVGSYLVSEETVNHYMSVGSYCW